MGCQEVSTMSAHTCPVCVRSKHFAKEKVTKRKATPLANPSLARGPAGQKPKRTVCYFDGSAAAPRNFGRTEPRKTGLLPLPRQVMAAVCQDCCLVAAQHRVGVDATGDSEHRHGLLNASIPHGHRRLICHHSRHVPPTSHRVGQDPPPKAARKNAHQPDQMRMQLKPPTFSHHC
ncbi:hypothetical protein WG78_11545 [Amantichitinum ursilacus]|uniref:Uncharacterized protein n=1 Tax=Amantichitinum ursilacus TaxID=857265 RepID=A0A0N0GNT3_9NEIS|nr:hypothetical protein WG78_11545 [Amantichitinum ursilacus]